MFHQQKYLFDCMPVCSSEPISKSGILLKTTVLEYDADGIPQCPQKCCIALNVE
jgi:hypothetical protein